MTTRASRRGRLIGGTGIAHDLRGLRPRELQDQRRHQGRGMNGRTPMRAMLRGCQNTSDTEVTGKTKAAKLKAV